MAQNLFWPAYQQEKEEEELEVGKSVAEDVLDIFGIEYDIGDVTGGSLENVDIKRADALSVLKASLLETYASEDSDNLIELRINPKGEAEFYQVGEEHHGINPYYSIYSENYIKSDAHVMITGGKPIQRRIIFPWYPLIGGSATRYSIYDTTRINIGCLNSEFSSHAVITYYDPFRHDPNSSWNNGIKEVFELTSPFQRFIGFSWRITPPENLVTKYTKIYQQGQSSIPVLLAGDDYYIGKDKDFPNIGSLIRRADYNFEDPLMNNCPMFNDTEVKCGETTVQLNIDMPEGILYDIIRKNNEATENVKITKFSGIQAVYVSGIPLITCYGVAKEGKSKEENTPENSVLVIGSNSIYKTFTKLEESIHYAISYDNEDTSGKSILNINEESFELPCIQFANNLKRNDNAPIGTGKDFYVNSDSLELLAVFNGGPKGKGTVLPLEINNGILIEQVIAQVGLDTPCFVVEDPAGNASDIAKELEVELLALAVEDLPSPIAIDGELINQEELQTDNDPTTVQDFTETQMELALKDMSSGRTLSLNFASLDEEQTVRLSEKLLHLLEKETGEVYNHTCPPTDEPVLGAGGPEGGIINTIEYSYTDQGSFLINVTEGPEYFGDFSGIDGGIYYKKTEDITTKGTIIEDYGNHVNYKVHVDGIGPIKCINGCAEILDVRDRVSVKIYNNAWEG